MPDFYSNEYADMIYTYAQCDGSANQAREVYSQKFPSRRLPNTLTFEQAMSRLRLTRNVFHQRREVIRASQEIFPQDLLQEKDIEQSSFLSRILWTDESQFTKDGCFNYHNEHSWAEDNPFTIRRASSQHKFSMNVWAGILGKKLIIGPFIFDSTLNGNLYHNFLANQLPGSLEDIPLTTRRFMLYQHDGAHPHYSRNVKGWLDQNYPNRWIGRNGPIQWPARSPALTPLDFFLWGEISSALVYSLHLTSREKLI